MTRWYSDDMVLWHGRWVRVYRGSACPYIRKLRVLVPKAVEELCFKLNDALNDNEWGLYGVAEEIEDGVFVLRRLRAVRQKITGGSVDYDDFRLPEENLLLHSHHRMPAVFSGIDWEYLIRCGFTVGIVWAYQEVYEPATYYYGGVVSLIERVLSKERKSDWFAVVAREVPCGYVLYADDVPVVITDGSVEFLDDAGRAVRGVDEFVAVVRGLVEVKRFVGASVGVAGESRRHIGKQKGRKGRRGRKRK